MSVHSFAWIAGNLRFVRKAFDALVVLTFIILVFNAFIPNYHPGEGSSTHHGMLFQNALREYKRQWHDYPRDIHELVKKTKTQGKVFDWIRYTYANYGLDKASKRVLLDHDAYDFDKGKVKASPTDSKFEFAGLSFYLSPVEPEKVASGSIVYRYQHEGCLGEPGYVFYVLAEDEKTKQSNGISTAFSGCPHD